MYRVYKKIRSFLWTTYVRMRNYGRIHKTVKFNERSRLNNQTVISSDCHFNGLFIEGMGAVKIGSHSHFGKDVRIINSFHDYRSDLVLPYSSDYIDKDVIFGDYVWVGSHVLILGGVNIGSYSIIQAGSVVVSDVPENAIVGGSPARVFKYRDPNQVKRAMSNMTNEE